MMQYHGNGVEMTCSSTSGPTTRERRALVLVAALCLAESIPVGLWMRSLFDSTPEPAQPRVRAELEPRPTSSTSAAVAPSEASCVASPDLQAEAEALSREYKATKARIRNGSRMLKKEPSGLQLWSTPRGEFWIPQDDGDTLFLILAEQSIGLYDSPRTRIRKGDVVLDVGAHVGLFAREALAAGAGHVIAMEPVPSNLECLRRNLREEIRARRVTIYPKGAWDRDEALPMRAAQMNSGSASFVMERRGSVAVADGNMMPLTTIDKMASRLKVPRIDFVKMDIEGAEERALLGAQNTIKRYRPRIVACIYHRPQDPEVIPAVVRKGAPDYQAEPSRCLDSGSGLKARVAYLAYP
jgi:FkbM family methyltransferase